MKRIGRVLDLQGQRFGRLVVVSRAENTGVARATIGVSFLDPAQAWSAPLGWTTIRVEETGINLDVEWLPGGRELGFSHIAGAYLLDGVDEAGAPLGCARLVTLAVTNTPHLPEFGRIPRTRAGERTQEPVSQVAELQQLAAFAAEFARALPALYRTEHDGSDAGYCEARVRDPAAPFQPPTPEVCTCGVDEHNARLDALADKLGIPTEQRRR